MTSPGTCFSKVAARIEGYRDLVIELQRQLVAIPAISPRSGGRGEGAKARFLVRYLRSLDFPAIEVLEAPDPEAEGGVRPNLVCRIPGEDPGRTVWVMSHLDVVPAGDPSKWTGDPFTLRVEDDRLVGRGTEDNHQGLVASVVAARAFLEEGVRPRHSLGLLMVADEETGSQYGLAHILDVRPDLFRTDDLIVVPDGGVPDGSQIEVAEKAILWLKFTVRGQAAHGSTPEKGINAHKAGAFLITLLDGLYAAFPDRDDVFDPPISTFEPTRKEANIPNINTIPGEDVFYYDCRVLPRHSLYDVMAFVRARCDEVERRFGVKVEVDFAQREEAAPPTPVDAPVVQALRAAIRKVYGVTATPKGIGGGTVAALLRRKGLPAAVWARMLETMHGPDEYAMVSNILGDAKVFACLACGG